MFRAHVVRVSVINCLSSDFVITFFGVIIF